MSKANDIFLAAFRANTTTVSAMGAAYWRGVLDALDHVDTFKDFSLLIFRPYPYENQKYRVQWAKGIEEGKRLWRINVRPGESHD